MAGFLGLRIHRDKSNKTTKLTQESLIDHILHAMQLEDYNPNFTPADKIPLYKELNGEPCQEQWNYRSIVGILLYLEGITRPDISYAVYQCARFSHNSRRSHETAVKNREVFERDKDKRSYHKARQE